MGTCAVSAKVGDTEECEKTEKFHYFSLVSISS